MLAAPLSDVSRDGLCSSRSVLASGHTTGDEADAASDDCSLQLPDQTSVPSGGAVQPDPCGNRQDQQADQTGAGEGIHAASAPLLAVHPADAIS